MRSNIEPLHLEFTGLTMFPPILKELSWEKVNWPFEDSFTISAGGNTLQKWGQFLQETVYALNQHPKYSVTSPTARIDGSRGQGVEMGAAPLTIPLVTY